MLFSKLSLSTTPVCETAIFPSDLPQRTRQPIRQCRLHSQAQEVRYAGFDEPQGNCWDNACAETLFASLKVERLHGMDLHTHREAKDATLEWLLWYNGSRMHSTLGYLSPAQFERQEHTRQDTLAA